MKLWFKRATQKVAVPDDGAPLNGRDEALSEEAMPGEVAAPMPAPPEEMAPGEAEQGAKGDSRLRVVTKQPVELARTDHKSLYKELLAGLYDAVIVADPKGHVIDCNARTSEYFLYSTAEMWDFPIEDLMRGINPQILERVRQNVAQNRHVMLDTTCRRKDGTTFSAEVAICRIRLINDGDLVFCVRNVERRRKAQQKLRSEHNAIMNAAAAFTLCAPDGQITFANPSLAETWGFTRLSDVTEQNIRSLWQNPSGIEKALDLALSGDRWTGILPALGRQGRIFSAYAAVAPDRDLRTEIVGVVCSFFEIPA